MEILKKVWNRMKRIFTGVKNVTDKTKEYLSEECGPVGRALGKILGYGLAMMMFGPLMGIFMVLAWKYIIKPVGMLAFGIGKGVFNALRSFSTWAINKSRELNERNSNEVFKGHEKEAKENDSKEKGDKVIDAEIVEHADEKEVVKPVSDKEKVVLNSQSVSDNVLASSGRELDRLIHSNDGAVVAEVKKYLKANRYKNINEWIVANPKLCVATSLSDFATIQRQVDATRDPRTYDYNKGKTLAPWFKKQLNLRDKLLESDVALYRESATENINRGIGLEKYLHSSDHHTQDMAKSWLEKNGYKSEVDYIVKNSGLCLSDQKEIDLTLAGAQLTTRVVGKHVKQGEENKIVDTTSNTVGRHAKQSTENVMFDMGNKFNGYKEMSQNTATKMDDLDKGNAPKHAHNTETVLG